MTVYQFNPLEATTTNDASLPLPVNAWTSSALVASWPVDGSGEGNPPGFYAVVASEDDTVVDLFPSATGSNVQPGGVKAGDFFEIPSSTERYLIAADKRVLVAQYMVGQLDGGDTSDPSMVLAVPTEQYRTDGSSGFSVGC